MTVVTYRARFVVEKTVLALAQKVAAERFPIPTLPRGLTTQLVVTTATNTKSTVTTAVLTFRCVAGVVAFEAAVWAAFFLWASSVLRVVAGATTTPRE